MYKHVNIIRSNLLLFLSIVCCLLACGLLFVYSASSVYALSRFGSAHYYAQQHCMGIILGLCALCIGRLMPKQYLERYAGVFFIASLLLTACTLLPFFSVSVHGSHRWIRLCAITFQPSEVLKVFFILFVARFLAKKELHLQSNIQSYIPLLCIIATTSSILLMQPDFGLTITLAITAFILAYIAGLPLKRMWYTFFALLPIVVGLVWMKPYRFRRIMTFINPWADPMGSGFQIIQSLIAIGSGNIWGAGISLSKQKFFYLPMQHTDFIFSIIAEETGFIGALFLVALYVLFLYFGLQCASSTQISSFARYSIIGFVSLISLQTIINISVTTGLVPTKGIGLPLISYGNTALVCTLFMVGLIINLSRER